MIYGDVIVLYKKCLLHAGKLIVSGVCWGVGVLWIKRKIIYDSISNSYGGQQNEDTEGEYLDQALLVSSDTEFEKTINRLCIENETPGELNQKVLDKLTYLRQHQFTGEWIYVFFVCDKIGVQLIQSFVESMKENSVSRAVLISVPMSDKMFGDSSILTPFAYKEMETYYQNEGKIIEHFYMDDLLINVLKNEYQPKEIIVLTEEEKKEVVKIHATPLTGFSHILSSDPVAKFLGLQPADMIKCICNSESAGETIRYRVCTVD